MDDKSRRLVDDDEIGVFVNHLKRNILGEGFRFRQRRRCEAIALAFAQFPRGGGEHVPVAGQRAFVQQRLDARARDLGDLVAEPFVEPAAGGGFVDAKLVCAVWAGLEGLLVSSHKRGLAGL